MKVGDLVMLKGDWSLNGSPLGIVLDLDGNWATVRWLSDFLDEFSQGDEARADLEVVSGAK